MAELRTAVGTLISKQRELSSSYASPISAARSAPRSRPASSARMAPAAASISAGPASAPSPPSAASATSSRPACSQCRRNASTVTVNPLGRLTPARNSSARRPILAPQTEIASSGATSSTQAMAGGIGDQPCPFGACLSTVTRPVVPSTSISSPSADDPWPARRRSPWGRRTRGRRWPRARGCRRRRRRRPRSWRRPGSSSARWTRRSAPRPG